MAGLRGRLHKLCHTRTDSLALIKGTQSEGWILIVLIAVVPSVFCHCMKTWLKGQSAPHDSSAGWRQATQLQRRKR